MSRSRVGRSWRLGRRCRRVPPPVISTSYAAAAPVDVEGVSGDASLCFFEIPRGTRMVGRCD